jgi:hypothetical protein
MAAMGLRISWAMQRGQALVAAALLRSLQQLRAGLLEADAVAVEAVDDAVEFQHAGARQFRHALAVGLHELRLQPCHMAHAAPQDQAQPQRGEQHDGQQHRQARVQASQGSERTGVRACHGPGGQVLGRRGQRAGRDDQRLAAAAQHVGLRLLGTRGALRQLHDQRLLGLGHVALDTTALVGGIGIGQHAALGLPDAALHVRRLAQHQLQQHLQQVELGRGGRQCWNRLGIARGDRAAGLLGHGAGGLDLGAGAAAVHHHHGHRESGAQDGEQGAKEAELETQ